MNKKIFLILTVFVLSFVLVLVSCKSADNENTLGETSEKIAETAVTLPPETANTTEPSVSERALDPNSLEITPEFVCIRGDEIIDAEFAISYLRTAFRELYGFAISSKTDYLPVSENEFKIVIGKTNIQSIPDPSPLGENGYSYSIPDNKTVIIAGNNIGTLLECAKKFCLDMFGYEKAGTGSAQKLSVGAEYTYTSQYPVSNLTICGIPTTEFTVLYSMTAHEQIANRLASAFGALDGNTLQVKKGRKADTAHAIRFSSNAKSGSDNLDYIVYYKDGDLIFDVSNDQVSVAVNAFISKYLKVDAKGDYDIDLSSTELYGITKDTDFNGLKFVKSEDTEIAPGVVYSLMEYKDKDDKPVLAHVVIAAPGSVNAVCGTPDAEDYLIGECRLVLDQAQDAEAKYGFNILSAVNADLFFWQPDLKARGMNVKDGIVLSKNTGGFKCFAVMKDGSYYIGNPDAVDKKDVWQMVGGHYTIVENGHIVYHDHGDDFTYIRHPRTAVGYREDGTLIMVVVDGRQEELSNGASLHDMGQIFRQLGAYAAVNLDGGGSSVMFTKDLESGEFIMRNSPSDHDPYRPVLTTLFFVQNPDYKEDK